MKPCLRATSRLQARGRLASRPTTMASLRRLRSRRRRRRTTAAPGAWIARRRRCGAAQRLAGCRRGRSGCSSTVWGSRASVGVRASLPGSRARTAAAALCCRHLDERYGGRGEPGLPDSRCARSRRDALPVAPRHPQPQPIYSSVRASRPPGTSDARASPRERPRRSSRRSRGRLPSSTRSPARSVVAVDGARLERRQRNS